MIATVAKETFAWKARDASGKQICGSQSAATVAEVAGQLRSKGLFVTAIDPEPLLRPDVAEQEDTASVVDKRVKRDEVIAFCQQLAVMLDTGVPLSEALEALSQQTKHRDFRTVVDGLHQDVRSGEALSTAMARRRKVFPRIVVSLVRASELSGTLPLMLERVSGYLSRERKTLRQIKGAMAYPIIMGATAVAVTAIIVTFVLPRFAKIYEMRATTLPWPTRALLAISDAITGTWMYWLPALIIAAIAVVLWYRTRTGRRFIDLLKLRLPILGPMSAQLYTTRASRTLSTLLAAGVGVLDAIGICRDVTNNVQFDRMWVDMEQNIRNGHPLSDAVFDSPHVPSYVASMIASGERSGRLPHVMDRVAGFADEELEARVKKVGGLIEPVMILVMGTVVGAVAIAMLLPIFSMSRVVAGG